MRRRRTTGKVHYVESGKRKWQGHLGKGIVVGQPTMDRIVGYKYDWRDAGMQEVGHKRQRLWETTKIWDPGR